MRRLQTSCGHVRSTDGRPNSFLLQPIASTLLAVMILFSRGQATAQQFTELDPGLTKTAYPCVIWGDYDNDGDLDLLVTGVTSSTPGAAALTRLYRNDGGVFTSIPHPFPDCYLGGVAWGDYDNDGDLDVVITGTASSGALVAGLWRNDGGGTF